MCQLLGVCADREVDIKFSFREWRHRGNSNPDGYGFAHWSAGDLTVVRNAANLYAERRAAGEALTAARSRIFVAHVRLASMGGREGKNTHPFVSSALGRPIVFAHNGTVKKVKERPLRHRPEGDTDSEHAFMYLLENLADVSADVFAVRLKALADDLRALGRFNFLMSDGQTLWAYADNLLHFIERMPPHGGDPVRLVDDGSEEDLGDLKGRDERAVLVATKPLTNEFGWRKLNPGELLVIRDGHVHERLS